MPSCSCRPDACIGSRKLTYRKWMTWSRVLSFLVCRWAPLSRNSRVSSVRDVSGFRPQSIKVRANGPPAVVSRFRRLPLYELGEGGVHGSPNSCEGTMTHLLKVSQRACERSVAYLVNSTYIDGHAFAVVVRIQCGRRRGRRHAKSGVVRSRRRQGRRRRQREMRKSPADRAGVLLDPGAAGLEEGAPGAVRVVQVVRRRGLDPVRGRIGTVLEGSGRVRGTVVALAEAPLSRSGRPHRNGGPLDEAGLHGLQERAPRPVSFGSSSLRMRVLVSHGVHSTAVCCVRLRTTRAFCFFEEGATNVPQKSAVIVPLPLHTLANKLTTRMKI
jgi:hypothetical protein